MQTEDTKYKTGSNLHLQKKEELQFCKVKIKKLFP